MTKKKTKKINDIVTTGGYGGINIGGLYNASSGIGTESDKSRRSVFLPTFLNSRTEVETIMVESWAAKRFVNLPVDQMLQKPRIFEGIEEVEIKKYENYLKDFNLNIKLGNALKAGRAFGSAFLVFVTKEAPMYEPLILNALREGDLYNVLIFDRYSVSVTGRNLDLRNINYQLPEHYHITPHYGSGFKIHHSRLLRFDGQMPLSSDGWTTYNKDYGVSEIIPVIQSIYQDAQGANGVSQLIEEASVSVMKSKYYREALGSTNAPDSPSLDHIAAQVNQFKSIYNTVFMAEDDEFTRQEVNFSGLYQILELFPERLAAAVGIPATVFLGKSPDGMNSTGLSDLKINADNVASMQESKLKPAYDYIDEIMTRTGNVNPNFDYKFPSLLESSEQEKTDVALKKTQIVVENVNADIITTDKAREILDGDPIIGSLQPENVDFSQAVAAEKAQRDGRKLSRFRDMFKWRHK